MSEKHNRDVSSSQNCVVCTSTSPLNRPTMREVIAMLIDAREAAVNSPSESPQMKKLA